MADIQIWDGTTDFIAGVSTPFGFYDDDLAFQEDAPKVARYCAEKLGWPVLLKKQLLRTGKRLLRQ